MSGDVNSMATIVCFLLAESQQSHATVAERHVIMGTSHQNKAQNFAKS